MDVIGGLVVIAIEGPAVLEVYPDTHSLAIAAISLFFSCAREAIERCGRFTVALSGGATPKTMFELLAGQEYQSQLDWRKVEFCWGDERCVPPDHPESNYRLAWDSWLHHLPLTPVQIHRIPGELPPAEAARVYEAELHRLFPGDTLPHFDLIFLGLGTDGHVASLFPGTPALQVQDRWVCENYLAATASWRVTLTLPVLNAATNVVMLVSGKEKASILKRVLAAQGDVTLPASMLHPSSGSLYWLVEQSAMSI